MERRLSLRGRTDIPVLARDGRVVSRCRGIEISATGIVVDRGRLVSHKDHDQLLIGVHLVLPESLRPLVALSRPIWAMGSQQALKFVDMCDVDRLNLAEHVDYLRRRGRLLN